MHSAEEKTVADFAGIQQRSICASALEGFT